MTVLVGIIANDSARYSRFSSCVTDLQQYNLGKVDAVTRWLIGGDWCSARNQLAQMTLDEGHQYLWFMDDDHAFAPNMLERLLAHQQDLVTPICLTRVYPFNAVSYVRYEGVERYLPIPLSEAPEDGLVEIEAGGCAGMLISRGVLESIEPPWFEYADRSEDVIFCEKAKEAGFLIYADLGCRLGHITTAVVFPELNDGQWVTCLRVGNDLNLFVQTADELLRDD